MIKRLGRYEQLILRSLASGDRSLYEIYQSIAYIYRGYSEVSAANVYRFAYALVDDGLILLSLPNPTKSKSLYRLSSKGFEIYKVYSDLDRRISLAFPDPLSLAS